jgi:hypothetical protein
MRNEKESLRPSYEATVDGQPKLSRRTLVKLGTMAAAAVILPGAAFGAGESFSVAEKIFGIL